MTQLAIVVPCYNEAEVLERTHAQLGELLARMAAEQQISPDSRVYYIDDGSQDGTWQLIERLAHQDPRVVGIKLSRNCGHQNALLAGLFQAEGDALISIDADLQDDIQAIPRMVKAHAAGHDVVYGVRDSRRADTPFKRHSAGAFYRFMHLMGVKVIDHHGDFRLLSRRAVEQLKDYREVNLFLRGIIPLLGFPSAEVHYDRRQREAGASKYPLRRMLSFATDGVTSFSMVPLRMIAVMGFGIFLITSLMSAWVLFQVLFSGDTVPGWASTVLPTYFLGGIQILCLGVIGEYLGKIYAEIKARPRYVVERTTR